MKTPRFAAVMCAIAGVASAAQPSALWGEKGEKYDPAGLLPDFSFAGYERGEKPIPERAPEVSVKDFGATGDGKTDDTAAFQRAVRDGAGKVIGIPAGRYILSDVLEISTAGTVLKGAGTDKTTLAFTRGLQAIRPTAAETGDGKPTTAWSWSGGLVWFKGASVTGSELSTVAAPGARRGDTSVPVTDPSKIKPGDEVMISVKDDTSGSFVNYIFRGKPQDAQKLTGKLGYRYAARVREVKGSSVVLDRPLRFDLKPEWSASLRRFQPSLQQAGIEDLAFDFPRAPYRGHWEEDGFNAVQFENCAHCWARRIAIRNCDSGVFTKGWFCTVSDLVFTATRAAQPKGQTGHHGLQIEGADNLVTRFDFKTRFFHELTVAHSIGNVLSDGEGKFLTLDHHKAGPYENLFTSLDTGDTGREAWNSGGPPGVGQHSAAGATFWGIRGKRDIGVPPADWGPPGLVFVGVRGFVAKPYRPAGCHYEGIGAINPPNLHLAQLARRLGGAASPAAAAAGTAPPQSELARWTTANGQAFSARFARLEGADAIFILPDGRSAPYPYASLSAKSRAAVAKLAARR
jgi:hypothetical protein